MPIISSSGISPGPLRRYEPLSDAWRATSQGGGAHTDYPTGCSSLPHRLQPTGVGGGRWYRLAGSGGDALPLSHPGKDHCGAYGTGWLSGWAGEGDPPTSYSGAGRYPAAAEGVAEMTACFDADDGGSGFGPCYRHAAVGVVRCDGFLLWRLADAPICNSGYCTAASGL